MLRHRAQARRELPRAPDAPARDQTGCGGERRILPRAPRRVERGCSFGDTVTAIALDPGGEVASTAVIRRGRAAAHRVVLTSTLATGGALSATLADSTGSIVLTDRALPQLTGRAMTGMEK